VSNTPRTTATTITAAIANAVEVPTMIFFFVDHLQKKRTNLHISIVKYHFDLLGISSKLLAVASLYKHKLK
jgi:hypothetical protein